MMATVDYESEDYKKWRGLFVNALRKESKANSTEPEDLISKHQEYHNENKGLKDENGEKMEMKEGRN